MAYENFDAVHLGPFRLGATVTKPRSIVSLNATNELIPTVNKTMEPLGVVAIDAQDIVNGAVTKGQVTKVQYHAITRVIANGSGTAIVNGDILDAGAGGVAVKGVLTTGWTFGKALQACTAADEIISALVRIQYVA